MPLFVINDNIFVNYAHKHMCYLAHPDDEINQYMGDSHQNRPKITLHTQPIVI